MVSSVFQYDSIKSVNVTVNIRCFQTVLLFLQKVKQSIVGTIDPCLPIILYALLPYTNLVVRSQCWMPQVANRVAKFVKLRMLRRVLNLTCRSILVSLRHEMRIKD